MKRSFCGGEEETHRVQLNQSRMDMKKKSLIETNSHLKNPNKYRKALIMNVASSTAIETGASVESIAKILTAKGRSKGIKKPRDSDH